MNTPWYKQFWPWFLIALPGTVVMASFFTFALFSSNKVSLVSENYYKEGKGINQDLSRLSKADELGVSASLKIENKVAIFSLDKGELPQYPTLKITFQHRTLADRDIQSLLNPDASGTYRLTLSDPLNGPWHVEISSFDEAWTLNARANFPSDTNIALLGKNKG